VQEDNVEAFVFFKQRYPAFLNTVCVEWRCSLREQTIVVHEGTTGDAVDDVVVVALVLLVRIECYRSLLSEGPLVVAHAHALCVDEDATVALAVDAAVCAAVRHEVGGCACVLLLLGSTKEQPQCNDDDYSGDPRHRLRTSKEKRAVSK